MDVEKKRLRKLQERGQDRPLVAGKTRSVYVPKDLVKEVRSWIRNHRRVKRLLSEISTLSIAIIQRHVPEKRAAARGAGVKRRAKRNNP